MLVSISSVCGSDVYPAAPSSDPTTSPLNPYASALHSPAMNSPGLNPSLSAASQSSVADGSTALPAQPPPGGWSNADGIGMPGADSSSAGINRYDSSATLSNRTTLAVQPDRIIEERPIDAAWYVRLDSFYWNERLNGADFVNEYGPLTTLGYVRHSGQERFRMELFGGTVAYDGNAQFEGGRLEPYHESNGTNYLGVRGEYDLLIEPSSWSWARIILGVGTRFWIRDLHDSILPDAYVMGYQETWWTVYPYVGLETKLSEQPGPQFFGSVRLGVTPLTYQSATLFDTYDMANSPPLYPRCGMTGQAELGVAYRRFTASAFTEFMTWAESAEVRGFSQPASRMLTVGGRLSYGF